MPEYITDEAFLLHDIRELLTEIRDQLADLGGRVRDLEADRDQRRDDALELREREP
jgi:hypothetical protein